MHECSSRCTENAKEDLLIFAADHLADAGFPFAFLVLGDPPVLAAGLLGPPALLAQALHHLLLAHLTHIPKQMRCRMDSKTGISGQRVQICWPLLQSLGSNVLKDGTLGA